MSEPAAAPEMNLQEALAAVMLPFCLYVYACMILFILPHIIMGYCWQEPVLGLSDMHTEIQV